MTPYTAVASQKMTLKGMGKDGGGDEGDEGG